MFLVFPSINSSPVYGIICLYNRPNLHALEGLLVKKFVAGAIFGIIIATVGSVLASSQLIGEHAHFNILVNGSKAELAMQPVVIDGSSYLPVRAISDALGYTVEYEESSRTIALSNDGKTYLSNGESKGEITNKVSETTETQFDGQFVNDLQSKYAVDGKLDAELVRAAIDNGILSVNAQDEDTGDSLLILAIKANNFPVYQVLKDRGVNPELPNKEGKYPIHIAIIKRSDFYFGELRTHFKVDTKVQDNDGKMPIDYTEEKSRFRTQLK